MTANTLQAVLRSLANACSPVPDAELLRRFLANDETAFAELVRRHGRLVWTVCRSQTRSDAEADDAFQATFLVLIRNARKIRDAGKLSSWLHGVAYKVCAKARLAATRRAARELTTAQHEGNGSAVADSAWDRALAAVHEEAAKLPETLRVPFVLCCLEGKGVTEAAAQLGWKLGTLSGRLTRAKDAVLAKLDARGLTFGAVATVGLAMPPSASVAKAAALAKVGVAIPSSILQLSQGVIGMSTTSVKVLAATVLLTCGLGLTIGSGWMATAEAQPPTQPPTKLQTKTDADAEVKRAVAELDQARARAEIAGKTVEAADAKAFADRLIADFQQREVETLDKSKPLAFKTEKWEYELVEMAAAFDAGKFAAFLQHREKSQWEFLGSTVLGPNGGHAHWLFRRPANVNGVRLWEVKPLVQQLPLPIPLNDSISIFLDPLNPPKLDDAKTLEAEIAKLQAKLKELNAKQGRTLLPLLPDELREMLAKLAEKKFGKGRFWMTATPIGLVVQGEQEVIDWATAAVETLKNLSQK